MSNGARQGDRYRYIGGVTRAQLHHISRIAMTKLVLGVVDVPYAYAQRSPAQVRVFRYRQREKSKRRAPGTASGITTGDVAQILEARYGVMSMFVQMHEKDIDDAAAKAMEGKLENLLMGGAISEELFSEGELSEIEDAFRKFLDAREMDGRVPGVPTKASLEGISHRFKHPHAKRGSRASFVDTGLYSAAMRAWTEE